MSRPAIAFGVATVVGLVMQLFERALPVRAAWIVPALIGPAPFYLFIFELATRVPSPGGGLGIPTLLFAMLIWPGLLLGYSIGWGQQSLCRWRAARKQQSHWKKD